MPREAPFGSWSSPISAADGTAAAHPVVDGRFDGDRVVWSESNPADAGRTVLRTQGPGGIVDLIRAPSNARTRVHEYGGSAWTVGPDRELLFTEFTDQRIYAAAGDVPAPLTPRPERHAALRYAELQVWGDAVWCVRETHADRVIRDICAIPLDGSARTDPGRIRSVVGDSDFLAYPRIRADGGALAWVAWNHPEMPWDGTELRVGALDSNGTCPNWVTVAGGREESVLQPEWQVDGSLLFLSDRSGFWNLYRWSDGEIMPVYTPNADLGGALWRLGTRWYLQVGGGKVLVVSTFAVDTLVLVDLADGSSESIDLPDTSAIELLDVRGDAVLLRCGGPRTPVGLRILDLGTRELRTVRLGVDALPDAAYLPVGRPMTFRGDQREVHAVVYPPTSPDYEGPPGELPPYVAHVHGGPTSRVTPDLSIAVAYFTSRGIGVVDVNYGGSTGYGREYRNRLRGQWGVVDVADTLTAVRGLVDAGLADPDRLAISGGSAGGWTVLSALTRSTVFCCGVSYFGVAELEKFVAETHDFESRYIDGLIGPLPEAAALYRERAPLSNVDRLSCPVLLLQGLDDPIVPPSQAERFRDALLGKRIPHAYLAFPGEAHGFRKQANQIAAQEAELSFYGQVMGFATAGIPVLKLWHPA